MARKSDKKTEVPEKTVQPVDFEVCVDKAAEITSQIAVLMSRVSEEQRGKFLEDFLMIVLGNFDGRCVNHDDVLLYQILCNLIALKKMAARGEKQREALQKLTDLKAMMERHVRGIVEQTRVQIVEGGS